MKAVKFEQANIMLAENQEEYETLPIHMNVDENGQPLRNQEGVVIDPYGEATCCFELNKEEIDEIVKTGRIYFTQCTFYQPFRPVNMSTQNPFNQQPCR